MVFQIPSFIRRVPPTTSTNPTISLWKVDTMLRIRVLSATYVNVKDVDKVKQLYFLLLLLYRNNNNNNSNKWIDFQIYVRTGVYHGTEPLCPIVDTQQVVFSNPKWDEWLEYELYIPDIPRSSQFCVSICSVSKKKRREVCLDTCVFLYLFVFIFYLFLIVFFY